MLVLVFIIYEYNISYISLMIKNNKYKRIKGILSPYQNIYKLNFTIFFLKKKKKMVINIFYFILENISLILF